MRESIIRADAAEPAESFGFESDDVVHAWVWSSTVAEVVASLNRVGDRVVTESTVLNLIHEYREAGVELLPHPHGIRAESGVPDSNSGRSSRSRKFPKNRR